jgi:hypothetical protein
MISLIATSEDARSCYARRWYEYGLGRPVEEADLCNLATVTDRFETTGGNLRGLMVDIAITDAFRAQIPTPSADASSEGEE